MQGGRCTGFEVNCILILAAGDLNIPRTDGRSEKHSEPTHILRDLQIFKFLDYRVKLVAIP